MEKMELKYLCGYLPHELKLLFDEKIYSMVPYDSIMNIPISSVCGVTVKPLLLPLSALTEPLPDGNIPIVELAKIAFPDLSWRFDRTRAITEWEGEPAYFFFSKNSFFAHFFNNAVPNQLQLFEYLYSIHVDIHGLIPSGLAFDKRNFKI